MSVRFGWFVSFDGLCALQELTAIAHPLALTALQKKQQESDAFKEQIIHVEKLRKAIRHKVAETEFRKEKIIRQKEKEKKKNVMLIEGTLEKQSL